MKANEEKKNSTNNDNHNLKSVQK